METGRQSLWKRSPRSEGHSTLFNGEFYTQEEDPEHSKAIGVGAGCYIDQVIGQWRAGQTGLGRIYDENQIRSALHALWRYNFVPEIGGFRQVFKQGRFYAMPGEAGLIMCSWPKGGLRDDFKAPITAAEGWGTYEQVSAGPGAWKARIKIARGSLALREVQLPWLTPRVVARLGGEELTAVSENGKLRFDEKINLTADGQVLELTLG